MAQYILEKQQLLSTDLDSAWKFFSDPGNLPVLTPPEMDFNVLTNLENVDEIYDGMLIDYTVKPLFGIKMRWQTRIAKVNKPEMFIDTQLKGPYKKWVHTHTFHQTESGILMKDHVLYKLPFGWIGNLANKMLIRKKLEYIFDYRRIVLEKLFKNESYTH